MLVRSKILILVFALLLSSCKDFLNVVPEDSMTGNNFWQTPQDVETFTLDTYRLFRVGVGTSRGLFLMADLRNAPVEYAAYPPRGDINMLARNAINQVIRVPRRQGDIDTWWQAYVQWDTFSDWSNIYAVVQSANILYEKAAELHSEGILSENNMKQYQAEAVFLRCASYFFLLRVWGDVPYYTNAFNSTSLPRTSHVEVAKMCLEDLKLIKNDLPWTYDDPANRGVRAMRGGAIALMMHLNMWIAGFDEANKRAYYTEVDLLGDELVIEGEQQAGAYELLPINRIAEVFAGRTKEGLFEIPQNVNYGDRLESSKKVIYSTVLHAPHFNMHQDPTKSEMTYYPAFLRRIYPEDVTDGRINVWFDENMYNGDGSFSYFKFFNFAHGSSNNENSISNSYIIFRYADALLLQAEAAAEIDMSEKAKNILNRIRSRANADLFPANPGNGDLKDAIYFERVKELMGEGHYFFDLVRTKKILDFKYCYNPISYSAFTEGAWTWPINPKAKNDNPFMTLNEYWN